MAERMGRGEMIRRLDAASAEVHERLGNGPLSKAERDALADTLNRLLPMVADELQDAEDVAAAAALLRERRHASSQ